MRLVRVFFVILVKLSQVYRVVAAAIAAIDKLLGRALLFLLFPFPQSERLFEEFTCLHIVASHSTPGTPNPKTVQIDRFFIDFV